MTASDKCTNLIKNVLLCRSHPHTPFAAVASFERADIQSTDLQSIARPQVGRSQSRDLRCFGTYVSFRILSAVQPYKFGLGLRKQRYAVRMI